MNIRARLMCWHVGVLTLVVVAFAGGVFLFLRSRLLSQSARQLLATYEAVKETSEHDPNEVYGLESQAGLAYFEVLQDGKLLYRTKGWESAGLDSAPEGVIHARDGRTFRVKYGEAGHASHSYRIRVAIDETAEQDAIDLLGLILALGIPIAGALSLLGGYILAGRLLKPVGEMAAKAREITADRLSDRLPVENPEDEFGRLASVFNETLARVQASFDQLRRFTSDASHELRTPLTAIRSVGEVALQKPQNAEAYRDVIGSMLEEVDRLARLVESLLVLTRADAGVIKPAKENVSLNALTQAAVDCVRVLAEEKEQRLSFRADGEFTVKADPALLRQSVMNLLDNAIKYTPERGAIDVAVRRGTSGDAWIEVRDTGIGIPEAHRARLFERFYRVDAARAKETGGVGLGLAIARWAAEIHGGRIEVESEEGKGSLFRIVLPISSERGHSMEPREQAARPPMGAD